VGRGQGRVGVTGLDAERTGEWELYLNIEKEQVIRRGGREKTVRKKQKTKRSSGEKARERLWESKRCEKDVEVRERGRRDMQQA
jgi:hypothetical protein